MKNLSLFILMFFIVFNSVGYTDNLENKLFRLLEKNDRNEIRANLELIKKKFPNQAIPYYVEAFIEKDAEQALKLYQKFIQRFPKHPYTLNAKFKVAQYHFAQGAYRTALEQFDQIIRLYKNSSYTDDASYLKINCLMALNQERESTSEIKKFKRKFKNSPYIKYLTDTIEHLNNKQPNNPSSTIELQQKYTIQVGAFSNLENARKLVNEMSKYGYKVEISTKTVNNKYYYIVCAGEFVTETEARKFGETFKQIFGLNSFQLIKK